MYLPMIDTLFASIDISDYEESTSELLEQLALKKEKAKLAATNLASSKEIIKLGDFYFEVMPNGNKGYAYILHNDCYEVNIAQYRSKVKDFFPIVIRIKSACLWAYGPETAWKNIISWVLDNIGSICANKLSRIDLCLHTDRLNLTYDDLETFKGKFFNESIYRFRRKLSGLNFGSSSSNKVYCRIYDKVLEVKQKGSKLWFFDVWKNAGSNGNNVWNVEFQIERDFLKEHQIDTVEDAFKRLKALWRFCTEEWIIKVKLDRTRIERCSTDSIWLEIQSAFDKYEYTPLVKRDKQLSTEADALIPSIIGNLTSYAARKGISDETMILALLKMNGDYYLKNKNVDFRKVVKEKMTIINR